MKRNILSENWSGSLEVGSLGCISNPETIDRINRELDKLNYGQCINPYTHINKIRNLLAVAGLSFDNILHLPFNDSPRNQSVVSIPNEPSMLKIGKLVMPLKWAGGPVGMKADGEYHIDDGVSDKVPGGLALHLHYTNSRGVWSVSSHIAPLNNNVYDSTLKEKSIAEGYKDHAEAHADLVRRGFKREPGGAYKDQKTGDKYRIHSTTLHVYKVNESGDSMVEEMDPVRDIASRKGLVGKIKGFARDAVKKYRSNKEASWKAGEAEYKRLVPAGERVRQGAKVTEGLTPKETWKGYVNIKKGTGNSVVASSTTGVKEPRDKSSKYLKVGSKRKFSDVVHEPRPKLPEEKKLLLGQKPDKTINQKQFVQKMKDADDRVKKAQKKHGIKPEPPLWMTGR